MSKAQPSTLLLVCSEDEEYSGASVFWTIVEKQRGRWSSKLLPNKSTGLTGRSRCNTKVIVPQQQFLARSRATSTE